LSDGHNVKKVSEFSEQTDPAAEDLLLTSVDQGVGSAPRYISQWLFVSKLFRKTEIYKDNELGVVIISK